MWSIYIHTVDLNFHITPYSSLDTEIQWRCLRLWFALRWWIWNPIFQTSHTISLKIILRIFENGPCTYSKSCSHFISGNGTPSTPVWPCACGTSIELYDLQQLILYSYLFDCMTEYATLGHSAPAISVCFVLHFLCCSAVDCAARRERSLRCSDDGVLKTAIV